VEDTLEVAVLEAVAEEAAVEEVDVEVEAKCRVFV
jgi:hypothetical protein